MGGRERERAARERETKVTPKNIFCVGKLLTYLQRAAKLCDSNFNELLFSGSFVLLRETCAVQQKDPRIRTNLEYKSTSYKQMENLLIVLRFCSLRTSVRPDEPSSSFLSSHGLPTLATRSSMTLLFFELFFLISFFRESSAWNDSRKKLRPNQ